MSTPFRVGASAPRWHMSAVTVLCLASAALSLWFGWALWTSAVLYGLGPHLFFWGWALLMLPAAAALGVRLHAPPRVPVRQRRVLWGVLIGCVALYAVTPKYYVPDRAFESWVDGPGRIILEQKEHLPFEAYALLASYTLCLTVAPTVLLLVSVSHDRRRVGVERI